MPLGMKLNPENRWVKKAETIPWDEIEQRYAELFESDRGNVAKPLRLALGALIIQTERGISDAETPLQIQETPCLQYFCGMPEYTDKLPFDSSSMVHFRKRLTQEILGEINEMIISKAENKPEPPDEPGEEPPNDGTLTVDATCAPQNIRYPLDLSLLNEAREALEAMIDELHDPAEGTLAAKRGLRLKRPQGLARQRQPHESRQPGSQHPEKIPQRAQRLPAG